MHIGEHVEITWALGHHPTTGREQWECVQVIHKVTTKFLVDNFSELKPQNRGDRSHCIVTSIRHTSENKRFRIVTVKILKITPADKVAPQEELLTSKFGERTRRGATGFNRNKHI